MSSPALHAFAQPTSHPQPRQPRRQDFRQHWNPQADRLPRWLHRVWAWF